MRIIEIAGVQLVVSDKDYNYYWTQRNIGENSDAFKVACRRLLGLGPDSNSFDYGFIQLHIWGDNNKDQCIKKIYESGKDIVQASRSFNPLTGGSSEPAH